MTEQVNINEKPAGRGWWKARSFLDFQTLHLPRCPACGARMEGMNPCDPKSCPDLIFSCGTHLTFVQGRFRVLSGCRTSMARLLEQVDD